MLVSPYLIKNLISVKALACDNPVNVEFDDRSFSVKERRTKRVILRCDDDGDLYPVSSPSHHALTAVSTDTWHQRLGHPGHDSLLSTLRSSSTPSHGAPSSVCHACQLGKHVRLPFGSSDHVSFFPFQLVHCDVWTSPVISVSGYQYYLVLLDDYSHFAWTFPLRQKSDVLSTLKNFIALVRCHFHLNILTVQSDNGREFNSRASRLFFSSEGIQLRMSCAYTSPQNGRAERILRTLNDITRSMLTHASMPYDYWVEALATATFLLNRRPCRARQNHTPFFLLHGVHPDYTAMRVFGCLCYPNLTSTTPHKLAPRSHPCVFLGYSPDHKGYRCLNRDTGRVIISRHATFDEHRFPFSSTNSNPPPPVDDEPTPPVHPAIPRRPRTQRPRPTAVPQTAPKCCHGSQTHNLARFRCLGSQKRGLPCTRIRCHGSPTEPFPTSCLRCYRSKSRHPRRGQPIPRLPHC